MSHEILLLTGTAASIGFFHTLLGPDHYLPFIMMARARRWPLIKTAWVTFLCGLGHVGSSVLIGAIGVALGVSVGKLESLEAFRGGIAGWLLIAFGVAYAVWGVIRAARNQKHSHWHIHADIGRHEHPHEHTEDHTHPHGDQKAITPWVLFTIFVLGPCEPLIPILMVPAARESTSGVVLVTGVFSLVTIVTMITVVILMTLGVNVLHLGKLEKWTHAIAGAIIALSGAAIQFLGL